MAGDSIAFNADSAGEVSNAGVKLLIHLANNFLPTTLALGERYFGLSFLAFPFSRRGSPRTTRRHAAFLQSRGPAFSGVQNGSNTVLAGVVAALIPRPATEAPAARSKARSGRRLLPAQTLVVQGRHAQLEIVVLLAQVVEQVAQGGVAAELGAGGKYFG